MAEVARENFKLYQNALRSVPKFSAGQSELFRNWERSYKIWFAASKMNEITDANGQKLGLLTALQGAATRAVDICGPGTTAYTAAADHDAFLTRVRGVFLPASESNLSRLEFENYKQSVDQPISDYATTKLALYHAAEPDAARRSYQYFRNETIKGVYSNYIKDEVIRLAPNDEQALLEALQTAMGRARESYTLGCGTVTSLDGLASTSRTFAASTSHGHHYDRVEDMEIGKISDQRCYNCKRKSHVSKDCRVQRQSTGGYGTRPRRNDGRKCHYCDKEGHFIADCRKKQKDDEADRSKKVKPRDKHQNKSDERKKIWKKYPQKGVKTAKEDQEQGETSEEDDISDESEVEDLVNMLTIQDFPQEAGASRKVSCHRN